MSLTFRRPLIEFPIEIERLVERTKRIYESLSPKEVEVSPTLIESLESDLRKNANDGTNRGICIKEVELTNSHGFFVQILIFRLDIFQNNKEIWIVEELTPDDVISEHHFIIRSDSLLKSWAVWRYNFKQMRYCDTCDAVTSDKHCLRCLIHNDATVSKMCRICSHETKTYYRLLCGHSSYCRNCLKQNKPQQCPNCRKPYTFNSGFMEYKKLDENGNDEDSSDDDFIVGEINE